MKTIKTRASVSSVTTTLARPRPPQGPPESIDPYFRGTNVLADPGFENFVFNSGGWYSPSRLASTGSGMHTIPYVDLLCPNFLRLPNGSCADTSLTAWAQTSGPYSVSDTRDDQGWKVSNYDPEAGQWHAAWWNWSNGDIPPGELCAFGPFLSGPFSARVEPGDQVTLSFKAKINGKVGSTTKQAFCVLRFYNSSFNLISLVAGTPAEPDTATYSTITIGSAVSAPAGSTYLRASIAFSGDFGNLTATFVDSAVLGVQ